MMVYLQLFWEFFKTGLFAIGGGMAAIPFLYDISDKTGWFTRQDLANMIAVSESTPGPIGVNMATYVGFLTGVKQGGIVQALIGSVIATLGLVTPSILVILMIAAVLKSFRDNTYVNRAFYGLRPASTAMVASAGVTVVLATFVTGEIAAVADLVTAIDWRYVVLAAVLLVLTRWCKATKKLHPIVFIALSAVVGVVLKF